jgi:hypothetical protein
MILWDYWMKGKDGFPSGSHYAATAKGLANYVRSKLGARPEAVYPAPGHEDYNSITMAENYNKKGV